MTDSKPDGKPADAPEDDDASETAGPADAAVDDDTDTDKGASLVKSSKAKAVSARKAAQADDTEEDVEAEADDEDDDVAAPVRRRRTAAPKSGGRGRPAPRSSRSTGPSTVVTVLATVLVIGVIAATVVCAFMWYQKGSELSDLKAQQAADAKVEQVASDYAVGAATFDYHDLTPWVNNLTKGVSPELKTKLDATTTAMNQLLQPLQWVSKATALDAVVNSHSGSIYKVNVYVQVDATNVQTPTGRTVNVVYNITLDEAKDWQITDVGNPAGAVANGDGQQAGAAPSAAASTPAPAPATGGAPAPAAGNEQTPAPAPGG